MNDDLCFQTDTESQTSLEIGTVTVPPDELKADTIIIGANADTSLIRADGDILFNTKANTLLLSQGMIFINDEQVEASGAGADAAAIIRQCWLEMQQRAQGQDA